MRRGYNYQRPLINSEQKALTYYKIDINKSKIAIC
jgi:hypothetical protein